MREPSGKEDARVSRIDARWAAAFVGVGLFAVALSSAAYLELFPIAMNKIPHWDKGVHFTMAALLFFSLDRTLRDKTVRIGARPVPLAAVVVLAVMGLEEISQSLSVVRTSSLFDYAADVLGVALVATLRHRKRTPA